MQVHILLNYKEGKCLLAYENKCAMCGKDATIRDNYDTKNEKGHNYSKLCSDVQKVHGYIWRLLCRSIRNIIGK